MKNQIIVRTDEQQRRYIAWQQLLKARLNRGSTYTGRDFAPRVADDQRQLERLRAYGREAAVSMSVAGDE